MPCNARRKTNRKLQEGEVKMSRREDAPQPAKTVLNRRSSQQLSGGGDRWDDLIFDDGIRALQFAKRPVRVDHDVDRFGPTCADEDSSSIHAAYKVVVSLQHEGDQRRPFKLKVGNWQSR